MFSTGIELFLLALLFFPGTFTVHRIDKGLSIVIRPLWLELAERAWAYRQKQLAVVTPVQPAEQLPATTQGGA